MNTVQREISEIAYEKWNRGVKVSYSELRKELTLKGLKAGKNNRGLGRQIKTTYDRAVQEKNQGIADCIASCFTNDKGEYFWK